MAVCSARTGTRETRNDRVWAGQGQRQAPWRSAGAAQPPVAPGALPVPGARRWGLQGTNPAAPVPQGTLLKLFLQKGSLWVLHSKSPHGLYQMPPEQIPNPPMKPLCDTVHRNSSKPRGQQQRWRLIEGAPIRLPTGRRKDLAAPQEDAKVDVQEEFVRGVPHISASTPIKAAPGRWTLAALQRGGRVGGMATASPPAPGQVAPAPPPAATLHRPSPRKVTTRVLDGFHMVSWGCSVGCCWCDCRARWTTTGA